MVVLSTIRIGISLIFIITILILVNTFIFPFTDIINQYVCNVTEGDLVLDAVCLTTNFLF